MQLLGSERILIRKKLALFCSQKCPGNLILKTSDLLRILRDTGITVISGFHTLMEKEALKILLRGGQPIILCPARSIENWRIPGDYKKLIENGRLLVISPFDRKQKRITAENSKLRNEVVVNLADEILVAHASPRSKTYLLAIAAIQQGKDVYTIYDKDNMNLIEAGAEPILVNSDEDERTFLSIRLTDFIERFKQENLDDSNLDK